MFTAFMLWVLDVHIPSWAIPVAGMIGIGLVLIAGVMKDER